MPRERDGRARIGRLEEGQAETNRRLGRIEKTLETSSRLFELMHQRLEHLENGQKQVVEGLERLDEGQKKVVERLDTLVDVIVCDRTGWVDRYAQVDERLGALERKVFGPAAGPASGSKSY